MSAGNTTTDTVQRVAIAQELERKLVRAAKLAISFRAQRDELIIECYQAGAGVREIARAIHMSHPGVLRIIKGVHHGSDQDPPVADMEDGTVTHHDLDS